MSKEADGASSEPSTNKYLITEVQLGIWKVIFATQKRNKRIWLEISESYLLVKRLVVDIYKISPQLLTLLLLSRCWNGVQLALEMRLENILLTQIELAVSTDKANVYTTIVAICCKVMHSVINSCVQWSDGYVMPPLNARLRHHFQLEIMKANLMKDLPTSKETPVTEISPQTIAHSLRNIFATFELVFNIFSQLWLLVEVSRMRGGNMLFVVFLLQVLLARYSPPSPWNLSCFAYVNNDSFKRMKSLQTFADGDFHQDIISNNLGNWIIAEYKKAFAALGNISTDSLYIQFGRESPLLGLIQETLNGIPSIYFAIMVFNYPQYFSIAAIATLQTSGRSLFYSFNLFSIRIEDFRESVDSLRKLYGPKRSNVMKDGTSCLTEKEDPTSEGISFSLKDVSFAYPTGGNQTDALKSINLDIKAGQLVVIVGANGSGKSTLIRILARLYDPSSGELLVNGQLATEYCIGDLHRATSLLSQDCKIYPLTLADNIGLGYPEHCSDLEMIKEAASEGGAAEFIEKLEKGYQTTLSPFDNAFHSNVDDREHPLWVMSNKMAKKSDISGGQQQRVIAARTFMRFKSGTVKFVVVDEPTSALDAESELQLFQRLMSTREGKTMVLVTHRFGHLTKFADQIICMKDGMIIERGTHQELMTAAGEYAKVYNIQAQAFSDDSDPTSSNGDL